MRTSPVLDLLRQQIDRLDEVDRRFSATVPVTEKVNRWLPNHGVPTGCIHEIRGSHVANAIAFASILSSRLNGQILCLSPDHRLHPLGLLPYGLQLHSILHVCSRRQQDLAWVALEALRCRQVAAVLALTEGGFNLKDSRRLQLAAESSGATGFFLSHAAAPQIASPVTRWKISSTPPALRHQRFDEPVWKVDLLYCRGGRPGSWTLDWRDRNLNTVVLPEPAVLEQHVAAMAG